MHVLEFITGRDPSNSEAQVLTISLGQSSMCGHLFCPFFPPAVIESKMGKQNKDPPDFPEKLHFKEMV